MGAYGSPDLNNNNDLNLNNLKKCKNCGRLYFKAFKVCPKCGKSNDNKSTVLIFWIIILALVIYLFSINIPNIINYYNRINENKNYIEKYENKELIYRTDLTFEQLSRTPDIYVGEYIEFTGTVIWNIDDINGYNVCLIVINDSYETGIIIWYKSNLLNVDILKNDNITAKGVSNGIQPYESYFGQISFPSIIADKIIFN